MNPSDQINVGLREIRSYKLRSGRVTRAQGEAVQSHWGSIGLESTGVLDLAAIFAPCREIVLEIGTGMGETTAAMASADTRVGILAIEVHRPGIGSLVAKVVERELTNVRIIEGDAITVLENQILPDAVDGVRLYFPDPWPKKRHHKRRIVQTEWLDLVASRLRQGGYLHMATDWEPYAEWIQERCDKNSKFSGGMIPRPDWRPLTRFENQGLSKGHQIFDFIYRKV